jgi:hypothetical protein
MKQYRLFLLMALWTVSAIGCGSISFDVSQTIPDTFIQGDPTSMPLIGTNQAPLMLDIQAETSQRHTGPASSAYLKDLWFRIKIPVNGTFYFASSVQILLVPKNPMSRLPTKKIAELTPIPSDNLIHLKPVPGVDMLPYANEGADISATAVGRLPMEDTTYDGYVVVQVNI